MRSESIRLVLRRLTAVVQETQIPSDASHIPSQSYHIPHNRCMQMLCILHMLEHLRAMGRVLFYRSVAALSTVSTDEVSSCVLGAEQLPEQLAPLLNMGFIRDFAG